MPHVRLSQLSGATLLALLCALLPTGASAGTPFLDFFHHIKTLASTVPANGDINPYGVAVVRTTEGSLKAGNILVSNFNNKANLQGTGTTIVQVSPTGGQTLFAVINPKKLLPSQCPGGVGLTTALTVLERGWVIVGSLPSPTGSATNAGAGCLIVLDSHGKVVETFHGDGINGPWDMTTIDAGGTAWLFVTNVLNGNVSQGAPHVVNQGTILRIKLEVPEQGAGEPEREANMVIASGFAETADPNAFVIGPTGLAVADDGRLFVADTVNNSLDAVSNPLTRTSPATVGTDVQVVSKGGSLNGPLGLMLAGNGDMVAANAGDGNLVEITTAGAQVATHTVDTVTGAGSLFGLTLRPDAKGVYFVDDGDNTLKALLP